ncbi:MAG: molybdopterin molybdotransferase MoeA [Verrucomicrobia bacterium]|nr:molybdopterin molybdotransferase MoeA [Verrucomicrobiota bacterium]
MLLGEEEVLARVLESARLVATEKRSVWECGNRIAAQDAYASVPLPSFDNSTVDGYAVRAQDVVSGRRLEVVGEQSAGIALGLRVDQNQAVRIFTGAPIPSGADAVLMQEEVEQVKHTILVRESVLAGENIRRRAEDLCEGQKFLSQGDVLNGARLAMLASQGLAETNVYKRPSISIIATGSELRPPGSVLSQGEIFESNRILLSELVTTSGADPQVQPIVPDDESAHVSALGEGKRCDAIVIVGGVSVGKKDLVKPALKKVGARIDLWRVAIRPGKPFLFGKWDETLLFGLPGNPVSAFVTFLVFVRPALWKMGGRSEWALPKMRVNLNETLVNRGDRPHYMRGNCQRDLFHVAELQQSHALFSLSRCNALCRVPAQTTFPQGAEVDIVQFC